MTHVRATFVAACLYVISWKTALADGPLVITRGGTYAGHWSSDDPNVPAVRIATKEPVVLERGTLTGRGTLIEANAGGADVTVRDVTGTGLNPNVPGRCAGRFFTGDGVARLVIEHCRLDGTSGIYVQGAADDAAEITIRCNDARNIDGRHSDGHGGYVPFNRRTRPGEPEQVGFDLVQFVQFDKVRNLARGEIAWNRVVNEPGRSRVEDNISLYESSGRPGAPIRVHDNCVVGGYTVDPARGSGPRDEWQEDWDYSGGGIMLGDGPGKTVDTASGHLEATGNVVVSTGNYGIAVAGGHDVRVAGNRVFGSARLADGRTVMTQNVGVYIWDIAKGAARRPATFFAVTGTDNVVGWWNSGNKSRNDWWVPDAAAWDKNHHAPGPITVAIEQAEQDAWLKRAGDSGNLPGVQPVRVSPE